ncbi:MAG: hypothetical protein IJB23_07280 [Alistipes sp.]|nr:hypothetical protein [Alistipes sp.]MBQ9962422.1 hypothetical protein [Alistipes sp.]
MQFRYIVIILLATIFTSCTITRGNSIGYYAVDDYTVFDAVCSGRATIM